MSNNQLPAVETGSHARRHRRNRRLASVRSLKCAANAFNHLLSTPNSSLLCQNDRRPAPSRSGESRTEGTGALRRRDDRVELGRAALVQPPTRFVRLIQQRAELLEFSLLEQLRRIASAR